MGYFYLFLAIIFEVSGTLLLPLSKNFSKPIPTIGVIIAYILSFYFLTFSIKDINIAVVYASWSGLGVLFISLFGFIFYNQILNWQTILGLIIIVLGVVIVNLYNT